MVEGAGNLPELSPAADLWPGISAAMAEADPGAEREEPHVIELPTATSWSPGPKGRVSLSAPQSAAAAIALVALGVLGTLGLSARPAAGPSAGPAAGAMAVPGPLPAAVTIASGVRDLPEALASELAELEAALVAARSELDPSTIRIVERNLDVIEQAIDESRRALQLDPGNEFLARHLERGYERKLTFLRDAVRLVEWAG